MGEFRPSRPGERRGGRQKGTPNKVDASIREMVLGALSDVGGQKYLARCAIEQPVAFLGLVGKVLPTQIVGDADGSPITLHLIAAQSVSAEALLIDHASRNPLPGSQAQTIEGEAVVNVLDQPPPLE